MASLDQKIRTKSGGPGLSDVNFTSADKSKVDSLTATGIRQGPWDAATNTPMLTTNSSAYPEGSYFSVQVAGTQNITGQSIDWKVGDKVAKSGSTWYKEKFELEDHSVEQKKLESKLDYYFTLLQGMVQFIKGAGFAVLDPKGYPGLTFVKGLLKVSKIATEYLNNARIVSVKGVGFSILDALGYPAFYANFKGLLFSLSMKTKEFFISGTKVFVTSGVGGWVFRQSETLKTLLIFRDDTQIIAENFLVKVGKNARYLWGLADELGIPLNGFDRNGRLLYVDIPPVLTGFFAQVNHIPFFGQSTSFGGSTNLAGGAITTICRFLKTYMFTGGLRSYSFPNSDSASSSGRSGITALVESGLESPCSGFAEMLWELLATIGITPASGEVEMMFSCPGNADTSIENLSKGSGPYKALIADITAAKALFNAQGKTYNVPCIVWMQGEKDVLNDTTYQKLLQKLFADLNADIKRIVEQTNDVLIYTYQTTSHLAYTTNEPPKVAWEQYSAANNPRYRGKLQMSTTTYQFPYIEGVHYTPLGSRLVGASHAPAVFNTFFNNNRRNFSIVSHQFQGNIIEIRFLPRQLPLAFETDPTVIADPGTGGFQVYNIFGQAQTITSYSIVRKDTVRLVMANPVSEGWSVVYGKGTPGNSGPTLGNRGTLRDSQNIIFDPTGTNKRILNFCPLFKLVLTNKPS